MILSFAELGISLSIILAIPTSYHKPATRPRWSKFLIFKFDKSTFSTPKREYKIKIPDLLSKHFKEL
jgi:hypothetical protein